MRGRLLRCCEAICVEYYFVLGEIDVPESGFFCNSGEDVPALDGKDKLVEGEERIFH